MFPAPERARHPVQKRIVQHAERRNECLRDELGFAGHSRHYHFPAIALRQRLG